MAALKNIRQERFCQLLKQGIPPYRAYPMAGYAQHHNDPYRLRDNEGVKRRLAEISRGLAMKTRITVESLVEELVIDREQARALKQPATAISATMNAARLVGLLVDRKETGDPGAFAGLQSEADIIATVQAELGPDAARQLAKALEHAASSEPAEPSEATPVVTRTPGDTLN